MIIVSRIIHVKVDRTLNVTNKFKYQRRLSSRLVIVMFRGTPCNFVNHAWPSLYGRSLEITRPIPISRFSDIPSTFWETSSDPIIWELHDFQRKTMSIPYFVYLTGISS